MKIAMLGQKSIPVGPYGGGVERHVEEIAERLSRRGHVIFVYVRSHEQGPRAPRRWRGIHLISLPTIRRKHWETIIHTFLATLHVLFLPVDVVHYHGVGPATLAWIPRIFKPWARVVVTFHSLDRFHKKWGRVARAYLGFGEWAAMHFPHRTIVVSHALQIYTHSRFRKLAIYIPNGVEIQTVRRADLLDQFSLKRREYLLTVARLVRHKGIHYLIQAFRGVKTDKKLVIVGAPSFTEDYAEYLARLASDDPRIVFTGFQSGETLAQLYAHAFLYVHPSESEGLSLTILEAMSYGAPALISDIPENLEVIDQVGYPFASGNLRDLRRKIEYALDHSPAARAQGRRGRELVRKKFSWDRIAEETERVYQGR
ncbi:glycosyltransferase family 4 protein [Candidatus Uhrbacteria bacterium]|nr:glycosyltransferase family 4 protein [Candidatus Uhrbacteria bacterium]